MSRIIVKNIPTFISESDLQQHFASVGTVTDCKVIRNDQDGKSRRFAFLGFKDKKAAIEAKKKYNSTYMGVSKIAVDFAKLKENEPIQKKK
jgi:multiple RNA-binding domain-containing protein 1